MQVQTQEGARRVLGPDLEELNLQMGEREELAKEKFKYSREWPQLLSNFVNYGFKCFG